MKERRKTQILMNGKWVNSAFSNIKTGDRFRLYELDGVRVKDSHGNMEWVATSDPYMELSNMCSGTLTVTVQDYL